MNDDFEARLGRLRPAKPPRDLMRRLRAAEPPPSVGQRLRRWLALPTWEALPLQFAACGGLLLAAAIWIAVAKAGHPSTIAGDNTPGGSPRPLAAVPGATVFAPVLTPDNPTAPRVATSNGVTALNLDGFPGPAGHGGLALGYSMFNDRPQTHAGDALRLEATTGPVRLECGYTLPGGRSASDLFGDINLNVSD